ncbi:MAG: glycosyltransferase family 39 protein [SAR324 cluster bacterium]|nr:glycosyltransferase family 39 protein [SAR324 cluster bacterium]
MKLPRPLIAMVSQPERIVILFQILVLFTYSWGIEEVGYSREVEVFYMRPALQMIQSNNYLYPIYEGQLRLKKPPLTYWIISLSYKIFGVNLFAARFPTVLLAMLTAYLTYQLGLLLFHCKKTGLYAMCALISSFVFYQYGRLAVTDMLLTCAILAAFYCFAAAIFQKKWSMGVGGWVCTAIAVLTKGPIGMAVPIVSLSTFFLFYYRKRDWKISHVVSPLGILLFLIMVLSWVIALRVNLPAQSIYTHVSKELGLHIGIFWEHLFSGPFFYLLVMQHGLFPWSLLLFFYFSAKSWNAPVSLLVLWAGSLILIFSFFVYMLQLRYLLPATPALALLAGYALRQLEVNHRFSGKLSYIFFLVFGIGLSLAFIFNAAVLTPLAFLLHNNTLIAGTFALSTLTLFTALWYFTTLKNKQYERLIFGGTAAMVLLLGGHHKLWIANGKSNPYYHIGKEYFREVNPASSIATVGIDKTNRSWFVIGSSHELLVMPHRQSFPKRSYNRPLPRTADIVDIDKSQKVFYWLSETLPDYLIIHENRFDDMPQSLREQYRVLSKLPDDSTDLSMAPQQWFDHVLTGKPFDVSFHNIPAVFPAIYLLGHSAMN